MAKSTQGSWFRYLKWGDFLIASLIVALAAVLLLSLPGLVNDSLAAAVLSRDGEIVRQWTAAELAIPGEMEIGNRGFNYTIIWQDSSIRISEADCPDLICVQTGWLFRRGDLTVCVPGHLILKTNISPASQTDGPDVIVR